MSINKSKNQSYLPIYHVVWGAHLMYLFVITQCLGNLKHSLSRSAVVCGEFGLVFPTTQPYAQAEIRTVDH